MEYINFEGDMAVDFGWSLDDFWEAEPLTPEEEMAQFRQSEADFLAESVWQSQNAQYCFD